MTSAPDPQRPILLSAARDLIVAARAERAALAASAPERDFYLGVEAAAEEILHPELTAGRPPGWPDGEQRAFQEGYLKMRASMAAALAYGQAPLRLRLPVPGVVVEDSPASSD